MAQFQLLELPLGRFDGCAEFVLPRTTTAVDPPIPQLPLGGDAVSTGVEWRVFWAQLEIPQAGTPPPTGTYYQLLIQPNFAARFAAMLRH